MDERTDNQALYDACCDAGSDAQAEAFGVLWTYLHRIAFWMVRERPDASAIASDCVQVTLIKIHANLDKCKEPGAFRAWASQIVRRTVLDELRRPEYSRTTALPEHDHDTAISVPAPTENMDVRSYLLTAIEHGPLSERSRRVVLGRYLHDQSDEILAHIESELSGQTIRPSHVQVTRAKNLSSLRRDAAFLERLQDLLD